MSIASREQAVAVDDLEKEVVTVDRWGFDVVVSEMTGEERIAYDDIVAKEGQSQIMHALLLVCLKDGDGNPIFTSIDEVRKKSWRNLKKLFDVAIRVNKLSNADIEALEKK